MENGAHAVECNPNARTLSFAHLRAKGHQQCLNVGPVQVSSNRFDEEVSQRFSVFAIHEIMISYLDII